MEHGNLYDEFLARLNEVRSRLEHGPDMPGAETVEEILAEMETNPFSPSQKDKLRLHAESLFHDSQPAVPSRAEASSSEVMQHFQYGLALFDGQFWEEAIAEFSMAAHLGYEPLRCWEYCGDCASRLARWDDAIRYYNTVYGTEDIPPDLKQHILLKITKCSQTNKKENMLAASGARSDVTEEVPGVARSEFITASVSYLDTHSIDSMMGKTASSWSPPNAFGQARETRSYRLANLLQVGSSSLVVELEDSVTGRKYAGQNLTGEIGASFPPEALLKWVLHRQPTHSRYLAKIHDLAYIDGCFFIVREHLPLSLNDLLTAGRPMPVALAVRLAYQVLEGLGDLHLQMGPDGKVCSQFHLDLRPSRVVLRADRPSLKIYNGGLWSEIERANPDRAAIKNIPLPFLAYRAPEQFRPYLARKRPPVFTDIYLFGCLFYEILTGVPPFKASSREEYEIQHCEQYPSPPKVWRPEIPDVINDLIVQCLHSDPMRRWRSTTQISLLLEKAYPNEVAREKDDSYKTFLQSLKLI